MLTGESWTPTCYLRWEMSASVRSRRHWWTALSGQSSSGWVHRQPSPAGRSSRASSTWQSDTWFATLASDPQAVAADLPDLTSFLLATGVRIGEALGLLWSDVDLSTGEIEIRHQVMRVKGEGLVLVGTKSTAGERLLKLPGWCAEILEARRARGIELNQPVFCDVLGGFRDPNNVRRDLRRARAPHGSQARQTLALPWLGPAGRRSCLGRRWP